MTARPDFVPQTLSRRDASGQIAHQLRSAINSGVWLPSERLPSEQELAETFDVSRATAREALKLLSATGFVESIRGGQGGTFVAVPSADQVANQVSDSIRLWYRTGNVTLQHVREAREELESVSVALAAERRTDEDLLAIQRTIDIARDPAVSLQDWFKWDTAFHTAIAAAAKNPILELTMMAVHLSRPAFNTVVVDTVSRDLVLDHHQAITDAIIERDARAAQAALNVHVNYLSSVQSEALKKRDVDDLPVSALPLDDDESERTETAF